jgi:hypothetical protein
MTNRYFVNPEDAEMKTEREWVERGIRLNQLIEISPVFEEDQISGFAMHINIIDLATMKHFHPVIEHLIAKATADVVKAAMDAESPDERETLLEQASRISSVMLKYYEDNEAAETVTDEVKEAIEQAKKATKQ